MTHYFPALTARLGELQALEHTTDAERSAMTPILRLPVDEETDPDVVVEAIKKTSSKLPLIWSQTRLILDATGSDGVTIGTAEEEAVGVLHAKLRGLVDAVPVVMKKSSDDFQAEVASIAAADGAGVCIRLRTDDFGNLGTLPAELEALLTSVGVPRSDADLVIDSGPVEGRSNTYATLFQALLLALGASVHEWRSLVLLSGAFPQTLQEITPIIPTQLPRADAALWTSVVANAPERTPSYGDYAVSHPYLATGAGFRSSANLRYTDDQDWLVLKAQFKDRNQGFYTICSQLAQLASSPLRPPNYSWGDGMIHRCASFTGGPGGGAQWKAWSTSHHLATVVDRLATVDAP